MSEGEHSLVSDIANNNSDEVVFNNSSSHDNSNDLDVQDIMESDVSRESLSSDM